MDKIYDEYKNMAYNLSDEDPVFSNVLSSDNYDEKVKCSLRYLLNYKGPMIIHDNLKNNEKSSEFIEKGNKIFSSTPWKTLLDIYTQAILYATNNSYELSRAYGNRSAALYEGGLYDDCILDIERALNIGYPDNIKAKLYTRKARCILAINRKMTREARDAACEARKWLLKMNDNEKKYVKNILDNLRMNNSIKKPFNKFDFSDFLSGKCDHNSKIKRASDAIDIEYSEKYGRYIVATRDIIAGEVLAVHKAYASIICTDLFIKYCWYCSKRAWAGIPCLYCSCVMYCNENCRDLAWKEHHDIECPIIPEMIDDNKYALVELLVLRLTVKGYKESGSFELLKKHIDEIDKIEDPIMKSFTGEIFDETKFASVYTLSKGIPGRFDHALRSGIILYYLAAKTDIFGKKITNINELIDNPIATFAGGLIMMNMNLCVVNCFGIIISNHDAQLLKRGIVLHPFLTYFNHSCDPMAHLITAGDRNAVISIQNIKPGEQIFINYLTSFWETPTEDRREALLGYNFFCDCRACEENWGPETIPSLPSRSVNWPAYIQRQVRNLRVKFPENFSIFQSENEDRHLLISTTINMINEYQHLCDEITQEYMTYKQSLMNLLHAICF